MLRQLGKKDGVVFVTILMIIMVMMTVTIGIISLNVSQVKFSESEVRRLSAEMLAHGLISIAFSNQISATAGASQSLNYPLDGITYNMSWTVTNDDSGPFGTDPLDILVTYF